MNESNCSCGHEGLESGYHLPGCSERRETGGPGPGGSWKGVQDTIHGLSNLPPEEMTAHSGQVHGLSDRGEGDPETSESFEHDRVAGRQPRGEEWEEIAVQRDSWRDAYLSIESTLKGGRGMTAYEWGIFSGGFFLGVVTVLILVVLL